MRQMPNDLGVGLIHLHARGVAIIEMANTAINQARHAAPILIATLALMAVGCGDSLRNGPGGAFRSALGSHVHDVMGPAAELAMYTSCEGTDSRNPETRCAGISSAGIEVFFDGRSLLFDFSNAQTSGVIADVGFEGYVFMTTEDSRMAEIVDAWLDLEGSSVSTDEVLVEVDGRNVAVNFRGLSYDDSTFVKVDMAFLED